VWFRLLLTPNQVGKSRAVGQELLRHSLGKNPLGADGHSPGDASWPLLRPPPIRWWWSAPSNDSLIAGPYKILREILPRDEQVASFSEAKKLVLFPTTGSVGTFRTCEQDLMAWEGDTIDIWAFDEEHPEAYFNAARMRLAVRKGIIIGAVTPIETARAGGVSYLTRKYLDPWLAGKWAKFRPRNKVCIIRMGWKHVTESAELAGGRQYKALRDAADVQAMRDTYSDEEARVRIDGEIVSLAGSQVYPWKRVVHWRQDPWPTPTLWGDVKFPRGPACMMADIEKEADWSDDGAGPLRIFEMPNPGVEFMLSCDAAEGLDSGDNTAILCMNRLTGNLAAVWHGKCPPMDAARRIAAMAWLYGGGWAIAEINGKEGGVVVAELVRLGYDKLYWRHDDLRPDHSDRKPGFLASMATRPKVDAAISRFLPTVAGEEKWLKLNYEPLFEEIRQYAIINGRPDHPDGGHDDLQKALGMLLLMHSDERYPYEARLTEVNIMDRVNIPPTHKAVWAQVLREKEIYDASPEELRRMRGRAGYGRILPWRLGR